MAVKRSSESVILEDIFSTFSTTSVPCKLTLTEKVLFVEFLQTNKAEIEEINISDLIGCHVLKNKNKVKGDNKDNCAYLTIYAYPLKVISGILNRQVRRERKAITFQMNKLHTLEENLSVVNKWQRAVTCLIRGIFCLENPGILDLKVPTRKILILINPKSGPGKAYQVFKERVAPLLVESDISYELLVTDRANCARDYVRKADLSQWNGIVVVSGDGLLFEVYNGLMGRGDWKTAVKIPVGVIPGGSGNGLARALSHAAGEPYDVTVVTPSVLNVIQGKTVPMDLVKVETEKECFFSFLSVGWGLMADIDIESERLRAIGEARFVVWGVIRALGLRKYKGRLSYLPVAGYEPSKKTKVVSEPRPKRSKTIDIQLAWSDESSLVRDGSDDHTIFRSRSFGAHNPQFEEENDVRLLKFSYSGTDFNSTKEIPHFKAQVDGGVNCDVSHDHCKENAENVSEDRRRDIANCYCPPLDCPVPDDWVVIDDEFVLVYACHQTHLSTDVFFAPEAKLDDGIMWLVMIRSDVSRAQVMYFLASLQTGEHVHIPYVNVIPIHAFRLEPQTSDGFLTVDGEVISCCTLQAEVLPSIARVMSR